MTISDPQIQETTNYMVPSSGATHVIPVVGQFSAQGFLIDWRQFANDEFPFQPQGVFIDNTQGVGVLTVAIAPIGWNVICPPGYQLAVPFPAPNGQTATITGNGQASVMFADFPVLPYLANQSGATAVTITGPSPLPVQVAPTATGGLPLLTQEVPAPIQGLYNNAITGATLTSGNITPTIASNLRKLELSLTGNVSFAVAGLEVITVTLNAIQIYKREIWIPAAATNLAQFWDEVLEFDKLGLPSAGGSLVVTVGTALATGLLEVNAWFG